MNAPRFPHKHGVRARCAPVHGVLRLFFFFAHSILFPLHASLSYSSRVPILVCVVFSGYLAFGRKIRARRSAGILEGDNHVAARAYAYASTQVGGFARTNASVVPVLGLCVLALLCVLLTV